MGTRVDSQRRAHKRKDDTWIRRTVNLARSWLFEGYGPKSRAIARLLDEKSLVPTQSAFSVRLSVFGFDHYAMFVPDLMHEFELGVWKGVLTHLIRILYAHGNNRIQYFNKRFRKVPTFGRDTIRRFHENVSGMKKLAARDFEDILQCILPVIEALLDHEDNEIIANLIFELANWHALAKLRLHTEDTLQLLAAATRTLGKALRVFRNETCERYDTRELPKEEAARGRREAALRAKGNGCKVKATKGNKKRNKKGGDDSNMATSPAAKRKTLNLGTYKLHALGDYVESIRRYGPTDGYSTQPGELTHRTVKRFYARTNKNCFARQIAVRQRRQQILQRIENKIADACAGQEGEQHKPRRDSRRGESGRGTSGSARKSKKKAKKSSRGGLRSGAALRFTAEESLPYSSPEDRYHISTEQRYHVNIFQWLREHRDDPACLNFVPHLKDHLLARFLGRTYDGDENEFSPEERQMLRFENERMYFHKVLRVNYTTYDMRRSQDSINPRTHADIMVLAHEDAGENDAESHPFWYARVIGIFHVNAHYKGERKLMHFLWVRWLGRDLEERGGFETRRLHRVGFVDGDDPNAFGFIDPAHVVRGAHLIPAFAHGRTTDILGPSLVRQPCEKDRDYIYYYVNMFVDRDMYMRYVGGGVGHKGSIVEVYNGGDGWVSDEEGETDESRGGGGDGDDGIIEPDAGDEEDTESQDEDAVGEEEADFGYRDSESDGGSNDEDEEQGGDIGDEGDGEDGLLGPEDGEDEDGEDIYELEGFAPL